MKHLKFLFLMMAVLSLAATSCKKDDNGDDNNGNDDNPPAKKTCYVNKIDRGDGYTMLTYNSDHLVIKAVDYDSTGKPEDSYIEFSYNNDGTLHAMISYDNKDIDSKLIYHYSGSTMPDSIYMYNDDNGSLKKFGVYACTYANNKLSKAEFIMEMMGQTLVVSKSEFTFTGDNVTLIKEYQFDASTMTMKYSGTTEYAYDSKHNPFHGIGVDYLIFEETFLSANNYTKMTVKDENGNIKQDESENITLEYNDNDYPTKVTAKTFDNSDTDVTNYTYDCI